MRHRAHAGNKGIAGKTRHHMIGKNQVVGLALRPCPLKLREGIEAVGRTFHDHPERLKLTPENIYIHRNIIDDERPQRLEMVRQLITIDQCMRGAFKRDFEPECRTDSDTAFGADIPAHQFDKLFGDSQSKSGTAKAAGDRGVELAELLEKMFAQAFGHTDPGICNLKPQWRFSVCSRSTHTHCDFDTDAAGLGELDGIAQKIEQHLPHARRIATIGPARLGLDENTEIQMLLPGPPGHQRDGAFHNRHKIEVDRLQFKLAGSEFGYVQNIVHDRKKSFSRFLNDPCELSLLGIEVRVQQKIVHTQDTVHRRPDLVAHICKEIRLGTTAGIGPLFCHDEFAFHALATPQLNDDEAATGKQRDRKGEETTCFDQYASLPFQIGFGLRLGRYGGKAGILTLGTNLECVFGAQIDQSGVTIRRLTRLEAGDLREVQMCLGGNM